MNLKLYKPEVRMHGKSVMSGEYDRIIPADELRGPKLMDVFLDDDDIQEMTVCSTNFGFVRTVTKLFRGKDE